MSLAWEAMLLVTHFTEEKQMRTVRETAAQRGCSERLLTEAAQRGFLRANSIR